MFCRDPRIAWLPSTSLVICHHPRTVFLQYSTFPPASAPPVTTPTYWTVIIVVQPVLYRVHEIPPTVLVSIFRAPSAIVVVQGPRVSTSACLAARYFQYESYFIYLKTFVVGDYTIGNGTAAVREALKLLLLTGNSRGLYSHLCLQLYSSSRYPSDAKVDKYDKQSVRPAQFEQ